MRLLISSLFFKSPFEDLQKHADKVKECTHLFREAAVCHIGKEYGVLVFISDLSVDESGFLSIDQDRHTAKHNEQNPEFHPSILNNN